MSGIRVQRHKVLVYTIAAMLAALAALVLSSKNLTAQAGMGVVYELYAIAMAVIGGVSLSGGRGSIIGTVIGALIFGVVQQGLFFAGAESSLFRVFLGGILIFAVIMNTYIRRMITGER